MEVRQPGAATTSRVPDTNTRPPGADGEAAVAVNGDDGIAYGEGCEGLCMSALPAGAQCQRTDNECSRQPLKGHHVRRRVHG